MPPSGGLRRDACGWVVGQGRGGGKEERFDAVVVSHNGKCAEKLTSTIPATEVCVCVCVCVYLSIYIYLCLSLSIYLSIYRSLSTSIYVVVVSHNGNCAERLTFTTPSTEVHTYISLSLSIYLYLCLSVSLYIWLTITPERFDAVVVSHNGKCAEKLTSTTPATEVCACVYIYVHIYIYLYLSRYLSIISQL